MEYTGNAIYEYIYNENLDYYFSAKDNWLLVYGNMYNIPKILVFVSKVTNINNDYSEEEKEKVNKSFSIARFLKLPFIFVRFMVDNKIVRIWEGQVGQWQDVTYNQLRNIYEKYGVVQSGIVQKSVNQYTSSSYHEWQRNHLGKITVSDFDLIKNNNGKVQEIIELKRSKVPLNIWKPYENDYSNFALLINTIVGSKEKIYFTLYYNLLKAGQKGMRLEDTSQIKVFDFNIPNYMISSNQVNYQFRGYYKLNQLLNY